MMEKRVATIPIEVEQDDRAMQRGSGAPVTGAPAQISGGKLRQEVVAEIEAMALFVLSDGRPIGPEPAEALSRLERQASMSLGELIALHGQLAMAVAPAKPRSILSLQQGQAAGRWAGFFGPTPGVRRLTGASLFFALVFFLISLSGEINVTAMSMSIYELNGLPLAIKLGLIVSAAGLGASFAALFSVWEDLRNHRYEPLAESASWMQVGLGVVAGLMLAEIIGGEQALVQNPDGSAAFGGMSEPLLALLGGFSAGVIHIVLNSIVNALKRAFGAGRGERDSRDLRMSRDLSIGAEDAAALAAALRQADAEPPSRRPASAPQDP